MNTATKQKICGNCKASFAIESNDRVFYEKFGVNEPRMCPQCRAQRRLYFRNERVLYKRTCDKCGKDIVSMYSPNKPYPVWCYGCWFADDWDATAYGADYDPARPFIDQVREVYDKVPKVALIYVRSVNSEYVNISADNKDCYMLVESSNNEGCIDSYWVQQCRDSVDLQFSHQTELAYESDDCYNCYGLRYGKGCYDCRDSHFLLDCRDCRSCIACVNMRNAQYCVFNEQLSKEDYEKFLESAKLHTASGVNALRAEFAKFTADQPHKYAEIVNAPGSTGNYIANAKHCKLSFHCYDAEDCKYAEHVWRDAKDCMDVSTAGRGAHMVYNSINCGIDVANHVVVAQGWSSTFLEYCLNCFNANYCLGSAGLRKKDYCILNTQYSREEYDRLRAEIVNAIKAEGVYGEFFPKAMGPFGYNETVAMEQFPLTKDQALAAGYQWEDHPRGTYGKETLAWADVPDSIRDFDGGNLTKDIFACAACGKNYRIIPAEFQFYRRLDIPLPRLCPDCRHERRMKARGANKLYKDQRCRCGTVRHFHGGALCPNTFDTPYPPETDALIFCEQCYNAEVM